MSDYSAPLDDIRFVLENVVDLAGLSKFAAYEHVDPDTVYGVLEENARFMEQVVAPLNRVGDVQHSRWEAGAVVTPDGFRDAYQQYVAAGWGGVPFPADYGGGGFPWLVGSVMQEIMQEANMSFSMCPLLTQGAIDMLLHHGDEGQKERYLPKMVTGEWTGTMNLTEPQAGSDVGAVATKAVPSGDADGSWRITGQKIFISFGEHDMADNIVHLVLARVPDAPPGTKGISCFIVPKYLVDEDGNLGDRNSLECVSIEDKMGIKASPTCVMAYEDAVGYLIGEANAGMRYMFTMMNNARLSVGLQGLALGERAYQSAVAYAHERRQGRAPGAPRGEQSLIVDLPDVRRMLLTMRALNEASRCIAYLNAECLDLALHHPDAAVREQRQELADLLTPITKGWGTDMGVEVTSLAIQVFGGMGYIEETGVSQYYRDARIAPIYEGTNGIQAMDLVGRKLPMRAGGVVMDFLASVAATADEVSSSDELGPIGTRLAAGHDVLKEASEWLMTNGLADPTNALAGATPYLRMAGTVTGGWLLAKSALAAQRRLDAGASGDDAQRYRQKIVTARFYCDQILPTADGLLAAVTAGPGDLVAAAF
ncbi:MAG TPA: acyl-CoA dehydrogenase C-terminal domain-containing protein [Acidimicrobiales bacterium]|nr:acyl-CoA dehydrogenase C-terminal domain-containing protein [Acidimicrobiales bacterium]